jgi:hypothetical protein
MILDVLAAEALQTVSADVLAKWRRSQLAACGGDALLQMRTCSQQPHADAPDAVAITSYCDRIFPPRLCKQPMCLRFSRWQRRFTSCSYQAWLHSMCRIPFER